MIRVLTLGSFLCLASCGMPSPVKCTAANCSGCCTEAGECLGGMKQSPQACGAMGGSCRVCLPQQLCSAGACVRDPDAGVVFDDGGMMTGMDAGTDAGVSCGARSEPCCAPAQTCFLALSCQRGLCDVPMMTDAGPCGAQGQQCCVNQQCTSGTSCNGTTCVATMPDAGSNPDAGVDAGVPQRATGEPCALDRDCLDGACLVLGFNGGYCTRACTTSVDCVPGSQCGVNPSGVGPTKICLRQCNTPGQPGGTCRATYVCEANAGTSGVPVCFPGCTSSTMCGVAPTCDSRGFCCGVPGFVCCEGSTCSSGNTCTSGTCRAAVACGNAGEACCTSGTACLGQTVCQSGTCRACGTIGQPCCASNVCSSGTCTSGTCQATAAMGGVGAPCSDFATHCTGDTCILALSAPWTAGYCSVANCTATSCPSGSSCSPYLGGPTAYCVKHCQWDGGQGDCRAGYVCDRNLIPNVSTATCIAACTPSTNCGTNRTCSNGFCCGTPGFRCCGSGTCNVGACSNGYCT